jgi:hypothetical protein
MSFIPTSLTCAKYRPTCLLVVHESCQVNLKKIRNPEPPRIRDRIKELRVRFPVGLSASPRGEPQFPQCSTNLFPHMIRHLTAHGPTCVQHHVCVAHDRWAHLRPHPALRASSTIREMRFVGHGLIIRLLEVRVCWLCSTVSPGRSRLPLVAKPAV